MELQTSTRYAQATPDKIENARKSSVPETTLKDTLWCVKQWDNWTRWKNSLASDGQFPAISSPITSLNRKQLGEFLEMFVLEVRKKDGSEYVPETLYHMVCGIMRHLREEGDESIDFFKNDIFSDFRRTLDGEMKRLRAKGLGTSTRKADIIEPEEEEILWCKGILGDDSPTALLNTVFYMNGLYFALRSGKEHRQLRHSPCQIEVVEKNGQAYLQYTEDVSKNNQGGLKGRKHKPKVIQHFANRENPNRCFVRIFKKYNSLCPKDRPSDAFYLKPLTVPKGDCWFCPVAVGHNVLNNMFKKMCEKAGISGFKTNHSLRATAATRLFNEGVDEQLIMERTGHHSIDGVRNYKRTSNDQIIAVSDVLNGMMPVSKKVKTSTVSSTVSSDASSKVAFNNCTNITINFN